MSKTKQYTRNLLFNVLYVSPAGSQPVTVSETAVFEEIKGDWRSMMISCRLETVIDSVPYTGEEETREEAIYLLEKALPEGSYFQICHQCRFGLYHPFQGNELSCLKSAPDVADAVNKKGKHAAADLGIFWKVLTSEFNTCTDFQRPLCRSDKPGSTQRV